MMKKLLVLAITAFFGMVLFFGSTPVQADQTFVTIGTGGITGVYYPTGGAIARMVNMDRKTHGIRFSVESTGGSWYNLRAIRYGELDMGIARSDWQYHAYHGTSKFADVGPNKELRTLFSVHPEPFTVVARKDSGIKTFADLKGKRVNVGNPGSSIRDTMEVLMDTLGWTMDVFKLASELKWGEQSTALCDNKIDAIIYTVGHPSGSIQEAATSCDTILVPVEGPAIDRLVAENAYYRYATIPGGMYRGTDTDTKTFGVAATVVSSTSMPEDVIYHVVKAVFENFDQFKSLHPAFEVLKKEEMVKEGLSAPLHDGALKYYKETGLINETVFGTLILTKKYPDITIPTGSETIIYGTAAPNYIIVANGAKVELLNFPGQNTIQIQSDSSSFRVSRSGAVVIFTGSDGTILRIPATMDVQTVSFNGEASRVLQIHNNQVKLDDQVITTTSTEIDGG